MSLQTKWKAAILGHAVGDALGVPVGERGLPVVEGGGHRAPAPGETPVFLAGDVRSGSSLVVSAIADAMACAVEVADGLGL